MKKVFTTIVHLTPQYLKRLKPFVSALTLVMVYCMSYAQSATDEKGVGTVIQKMDDAWNAHDYSYSGKYDFYAPDATLVNPVGMYWKNRAEIIKAHQVFGEMMFKYTSARSEKLALRFLSPTVALATVKVHYRFEQDFNNSPDGKAHAKGDMEYAIIDVVFIKQNAAWKIAAQQVTSFDPQVQAQDPVKR